MTNRAFILVTATPPGEAPVEVRKAWVGLILPLAPEVEQPSASPPLGVRSGPKGLISSILATLFYRGERVHVYSVLGSEAIEVLERSHPDAAQWWRNSATHVLRQGMGLGFPVDVCVVVAANDAV